ncbi:MAG: polyamine aminopropyltransferase, partial [Proteobacteria bacterium]|nr:polyamine aminopropyltransferase [Pseudomonadota bacterium]
MEWFEEALHPGLTQGLSMDRILFREKTELQDLVIFENRIFGRVLALDGVVQTTEGDEFIYHEMLSHVPILAHGAASRVLIIGGGDGGMAREVLKHPGVRTVTMVEIDPSVIELCRNHLPSISAGAFDDPRLDLVIADGAAFVEVTNDRWDVIIIDSTDPLGPGEVLFGERFYRGCKRCLT